MEAILAKLLKQHLKLGKLNLASLVLIACNAAEVFARDVREIHGQQKLTLALEKIPEILKMSVDDGYITVDEEVALQHRIDTNKDVILHMIECFVLVANNPTILALTERVAKCCKR